VARRKGSSSAAPATAGPNGNGPGAGERDVTLAKPPGSRADYVHAVLRQEILDGTLAPGTPILQDEIGARLGVSITPVREALRRLESVGLVSYQMHYGATVTEMSDESAQELYLLRGTVEGLIARLAATKITDDELRDLRTIHADMKQALTSRDVPALAEGSRRFHAVIAQAGGPAFLARHLEWIWENYPVPVSESIWQYDDVARRGIADHGALLKALAGRDGATAGRLMEKHISKVAQERASCKHRSLPC